MSDVVADHVASLARLTITDQVRASGNFASAQPVDETAGSLDRLIGFTGRMIAA